MLIISFFRYFSLYWSLEIHITQAERGDRCHAARPLSSWRYVCPLQWLWVNWLVRLATGALASWRGLVRTRLGGPLHSSMIGKSRAVTDGETLTPHTTHPKSVVLFKMTGLRAVEAQWRPIRIYPTCIWIIKVMGLFLVILIIKRDTLTSFLQY